MKRAKPDPAMRLEIVRIFDAPRQLVYAAWTTPEHLAKWSAPKGFTIPEATNKFSKGRHLLRSYALACRR